MSDIDDTIKISGVKDGVGTVVKNAFRTHVYFKQMPELMNELTKLDSESKVVYLSNAPQWLMKNAHTKLLKNGHFPKGTLILRSGLPKTKHKIVNLRRLIKAYQPDEVILIGDIGESDALIYHQIAKENTDISIHQFIRMVYSGKEFTSKLSPEQISFVTPVEIATYFNHLLSDNTFTSIIQTVVSQLVGGDQNKTTRKYGDVDRDDKPAYFPEWQNCSSFQWTMGDLDQPLIQKYLGFLQKRCR